MSQTNWKYSDFIDELDGASFVKKDKDGLFTVVVVGHPKHNENDFYISHINLEERSLKEIEDILSQSGLYDSLADLISEQGREWKIRLVELFSEEEYIVSPKFKNQEDLTDYLKEKMGLDVNVFER